MKILVLGGTGRTGRLIAAQLVTDGHDVIVGRRRNPEISGAKFCTIDLMDAEAVREAATGMDAVISALASGKGNPICSSIARALADNGELRFITIAGGGVDAAGDAKGLGDKMIGWVMRRIVPEMLADRQTELGILQQSRLRWTMLRPPRLTDAKKTGRSKITFDRPASTAISRADLAQAVVDALSVDVLVGRAPFVAG